MKTEFENKSCDQWEIKVATSFEEIEDIRPVWEQMQSEEPSPIPNADIDRYLSVIKTSGDGVRPHVMVMKSDDRPVAMTIGRIEQRRLDLKLGYKTLFSPELRCLSIVYGGVIGQPSAELSEMLIGELMKKFRSQKVDVLFFNHLKTETVFYQCVRKMPGLLTRDYFPKVEDHWRMSIPENVDQFYSARKRGHRYKLRKSIRRFEEEFPCHNMLIQYSATNEVEDFITKAADISSKTYQSALGVGIVNDEKTKSLLKEAAMQGWFRGNILLADSKPCAFLLGLVYKNIFYGVCTGYDPAFRSYWPGTIIFLKVVESLCADPSIEMIDFYFGDAWYKKSYGTEHWPEASAYIFAPRLRMILINLLRSSMMCMNHALGYLVNKINAVDWIKRKWRGLLRPKSSTESV
jgi:hypothetical protein